jgi:hypothetical protein
MGMTTRSEYKVVNCKFSKHKCRLCAMGNQQLEVLQYIVYNARDLYALVLKPHQVETSGSYSCSQQDLYY